MNNTKSKESTGITGMCLPLQDIKGIFINGEPLDYVEKPYCMEVKQEPGCDVREKQLAVKQEFSTESINTNCDTSNHGCEDDWTGSDTLEQDRYISIKPEIKIVEHCFSDNESNQYVDCTATSNRVENESIKNIYIGNTSNVCDFESIRNVNCSETRNITGLNKCKLCRRTFNRGSTLTQHLMMHARNSNNLCTLCNKQFPSAGCLAYHIKLHDKYPYQCSICNSQHRSKTRYQFHLISHINPGDNPCPICGVKFSMPQYLKRHQISMHHQCPKCNAVFDTDAFLQDHTLTDHAGSMLNKCDVCAQKFPRPLDLERHAITHSGFKAFKCKHCSMGFDQRRVLTQHLINHGVKSRRCLDKDQDFNEEICYPEYYTIPSSFLDQFKGLDHDHQLSETVTADILQTDVGCGPFDLIVDDNLIEEEDINKCYCRLCLHTVSEEEGIYIFSEDSSDIVNMINTSLPIMVLMSDPLPKQICKRCLRKLKLHYEFSQSCLKTEAHLVEIYKPLETSDETPCRHRTQRDDVRLDCPLCPAGCLLKQSGVFKVNAKSGSLHCSLRKNECISNMIDVAVDDVHVNDNSNSSENIDIKSFDNIDVLSGEESNGTREHLLTCQLCSVKLSTWHDSYVHSLAEHVVDKIVTCCLCSTELDIVSSFEHFDSSHNGDKECTIETIVSVCSECGIVFDRENDYELHKCQIKGSDNTDHLLEPRTECQNVTPMRSRVTIACKECPKKFKCARRYEFHMLVHQGLQTLVCKPCNKLFVDENVLYRHKLLTHKKTNCPVCDETLANHLELSEHLITNHSDVWHQCNDCKKVCLIENHENECPTVNAKRLTPEPTQKCSMYCKSVFMHHPETGIPLLNKRELTKRNKQQPNNQNKIKNRKCPHCPKGFNSGFSLAKHIRCHTGEKPYICSVCGKRFSQSSGLKTHNKVHSDERPYPCSECPRRFKIKGDRDRHNKNHSGDRPYQCEVCNKRFMTQHVCSQHRKIHTNERPFKCQLCGLAFQRSHVLTVHMRRHTGEKPNHCTMCTKKYRQRGDLLHHMRVQHGIYGENYKRVVALRGKAEHTKQELKRIVSK